METIKLVYPVEGGDLIEAGEASSKMKLTLKKLGLPQDVIRRASICMYEGEINMVIHADGGQAEVEVETYDRQIAPGEYIMLSSDGVWEYYSDEELLSYFQKGSEPSLIAKRLVQVCLERGADDNATVAIIRRRPR